MSNRDDALHGLREIAHAIERHARSQEKQASALNRIADEMQRTNDMNEAIRPTTNGEGEPAKTMVTTPAQQFYDPDDDLPDDTAEILTDDPDEQRG